MPGNDAEGSCSTIVWECRAQMPCVSVLSSKGSHSPSWPLRPSCLHQAHTTFIAADCRIPRGFGQSVSANSTTSPFHTLLSQLHISLDLGSSDRHGRVKSSAGAWPR